MVKETESGDESKKNECNRRHGVSPWLYYLALGTFWLQFATSKIADLNYQRRESELVATIDRLSASHPLANNSLILISGKDATRRDLRCMVPTKEYLKYKNTSHKTNGEVDYLDFVTPNDYYIRDIARNLRQSCTSNEQYAQAVLDFVHRSVAYDNKIELNGDFVRHPLETLVERNGDCEDLAILTASLMRAEGLEVALLHVDVDDETSHMAVGVCGNFSGTSYDFEGKKYFYAEATGTQYLSDPSTQKIGECSKDFQRRADILVVE